MKIGLPGSHTFSQNITKFGKSGFLKRKKKFVKKFSHSFQIYQNVCAVILFILTYWYLESVHPFKSFKANISLSVKSTFSWDTWYVVKFFSCEATLDNTQNVRPSLRPSLPWWLEGLLHTYGSVQVLYKHVLPNSGPPAPHPPKRAYTRCPTKKWTLLRG